MKQRQPLISYFQVRKDFKVDILQCVLVCVYKR